MVVPCRGSAGVFEGADREGFAAVDVRRHVGRRGRAGTDQPRIDVVRGDIILWCFRGCTRRKLSFGRGGDIQDRHRESQRPDLNEVAILEPAGVGRQGLTVDQGPVTASQIADVDHVSVDGEFRMLTTDLFAVRPQVAGLAPANLEFRPDQGDYLPFGFAANNYELHFHRYRPDLYGLQ